MQRPHLKNWPALLSLAVVVAVSGCSTGPIEAHADGPYYFTIEEIRADSDLVVSGTVTQVSYDFIYPQYEGEDPESNPLAGTDRTPSDEELDDAIAVTIYTVDVEAVAPGTYAGEDRAEVGVLRAAVPGALISVQQAGGYNADGRQVVVNGMSEIAALQWCSFSTIATALTVRTHSLWSA